MVHEQKGILVLTATHDDLAKGEVSEPCSKWESECEIIRMIKRHFRVPFAMTKYNNVCPTCHGMADYIDGVKQYLDSYAHMVGLKPRTNITVNSLLFAWNDHTSSDILVITFYMCIQLTRNRRDVRK